MKNTDAGKFFDRVHIDWGTVPGGYAWIFPKNDHISVGVGCPAAVSKYLKTYYTNIIDNLNIPVADVLSLRAHSIPCRSKKGRYSNGNILLIGDSAGLTDGLTGEGIYYAIRSGQIAAKVITEYISGSIADIDQHYSVMINEEIMKELLAVFPILHIFHAFPYRAHRFIRDNDRAWNAFIRVLRGEKSYTSFPETLGYYRFMWKAIDNTAGMLYERNMKKFMRR